MKKALLLIVSGVLFSTYLYSGIYSGGDGASPETAYQIANTSDLLELSHTPSDWNSYFIQVADIIFNPDETQIDWDGDGVLEHPGDDGLGFSAIGNINVNFTGNYNGQGYSIEGLYINRNSGIYVGLFGWVNGLNGATIENINLVQVETSGKEYVGGLIGISMGATVTNCNVSGSVTGDTDHVGGLIAYATGNSTISFCHTSAQVVGYSLTGGLIGLFKNPGTLFNCSSDCTVTAIEGEVGGLIGHNLGQVENCHSAGSIYGPFLSGGLIGINEGIINNCYSTAETSGTIMIGGLAGSNENGEINKCYATGFVSGQFYLGGLIGDNSSGTISNAFWDMETSGQTTSDGGTGKTTAQLKSISTYTDMDSDGVTEPWDFIGFPNDDSGSADDWNMAMQTINDGYPYFSWQNNTSAPIVTTLDASNISNSAADLGGSVTGDGGSPVTARGVIYSLTNEEPEIGGQDVTENENSSGTGDFMETISGLEAGSLYYFRAYAINLLGVSYGEVKTFNTALEMVIWKGYEDENWNNPANWSNESVPQANENVTIPYMPDILPTPVIGANETADCNNLTIEPGGKLTIISNESGTGSLITLGEPDIQGTFEIQRYIQDDALHFIAVPVQGETADKFLGDYLLQWDEPGHQWINIVDPQEDLSLINGYGLQPATGSPKTYTFQGIPYTGNLSHNITFTEYSNDPDANEGANLLGNPYPSSIDWSILDDTWGAVYFWNPELECYATWNNGMSTNGGTQFIPPTQGFFIVASEPGTIHFENTMRTHEGAGGFFKTQSNISPNSILLEARDQNHGDELLIGFDINSSGGFDLQYDAFKFFTEKPGSPEIYTINTYKNFSIDVRPEGKTIQLGFRNENPGIYRIGIKEINDIEYAYIEDNKSGKFHDLTTGAYEFMWNAGDDETRFELHLHKLEIPDPAPNEPGIQIYSCENCIYINSQENCEMIVYDMMSSIVFRENLSTSGLTGIPVNLREGVYIVRVITETNKVHTHSIYIE